jgi:tetratricopeptide (TPR) repeat protein
MGWELVTWPWRLGRGALKAFRLWRRLEGDADARICLGFKRQQEILSERLREAQASGDAAEEARTRQLLRRVQDNELSYHQSRLADLAEHVVADRAPTGVITADLPKLPEPQRAVLENATRALAALRPALTAAAHFARGNAFYTTERFHDALEAYNAALALQPDDPTILNNRGVTLDELKRYEEALADYNRALELRPDHPDVLNNRGIALLRLNRHDEALADYNRSLQLRPDHPDTLNNRGVTLEHLGRYEEALADYNRALELRPDDPDTLNNRGFALAKRGRSEEALADLDRSLDIRPDDPDTLSSRALALAKLGQQERAFADFARALAPNPTEPHILYDRACALSVAGRWGEALRDLAQAIAGHAPYRASAREDNDLEPLRNHPEWGPKFWELVGTEDEP